MRRALLQTYDFEQRRRLVEKVVPRGAEYGFFLNADGTADLKGVFGMPGQVPSSTGKLARWPTPAEHYTKGNRPPRPV
jgi:hypothetical protein